MHIWSVILLFCSDENLQNRNWVLRRKEVTEMLGKAKTWCGRRQREDNHVGCQHNIITVFVSFLEISVDFIARHSLFSKKEIHCSHTWWHLGTVSSGQYYSAAKFIFLPVTGSFGAPKCSTHPQPKVTVKITQSCPTLWLHGQYSPWNSTGQNSGVGSLSLLQGIFPTQGLNPGLPHCRQILYQLSYREARSNKFRFIQQVFIQDQDQDQKY